MRDRDLERELRNQLDPSEQVLWVGRPIQGVTFGKSDVLMVPFSLLWCGFAIFWFYLAYTSGAPLEMLGFGSIFVVVGLHFVIGRFFVEAYKRSNTIYAITDHRVVIHSQGFPRSIKSVQLRALSDISLQERSAGRGDIQLGRSAFGGMIASWPGLQSGVPQLEGIENAKSVFEILNKAQRKA